MTKTDKRVCMVRLHWTDAALLAGLVRDMAPSRGRRAYSSFIDAKLNGIADDIDWQVKEILASTDAPDRSDEP